MIFYVDSGDSFLGDEGLENRGHSFQGGNDMEREYGRRGDYQYEAGDYNAEAPASALVRGRGEFLAKNSNKNGRFKENLDIIYIGMY